MNYEVKVMPSADKSIKKWKKSNPNLYNKFKKIVYELMIHPRTGTGHPEPISYFPQFNALLEENITTHI